MRRAKWVCAGLDGLSVLPTRAGPSPQGPRGKGGLAGLVSRCQVSVVMKVLTGAT